MSLPEYEHEWQAEVERLRAEVAALRETTEARAYLRLAELNDGLRRELAEARAPLEHIARCGDENHEHDAAWLERCFPRAFLRRDERENDEGSKSAVQHAVGNGGRGGLFPRGPVADGKGALTRDEGPRHQAHSADAPCVDCAEEFRARDEAHVCDYRCAGNYCTRDEAPSANRCDSCGQSFVMRSDYHLHPCPGPARDEARPEPQSNVHCDDQECWCATARDEADE